MPKPQVIGYFADAEVGGSYFFFCYFYQFFVDVVLRIVPGMHAQQAAQIPGRDVQLRCQIIYHRQAGCSRPATAEILVQQILKAMQYVVISFFARKELAVIKSISIVQQAFQLGNNDLLAELIYVSMCLAVYIPDDTGNGFFLVF